MRRFLLVAVMCGSAGVAQAADMPDLPFLRGSFTEGLSATSVNWQGFYVGGQVSYGSVTSKVPSGLNSDLRQFLPQVPPPGVSLQLGAPGKRPRQRHRLRRFCRIQFAMG